MMAWLRAAGFLLLSPLLFAQWPVWPAARAPRNANKQVNLTAPAPKAADGHPDLSGVWDRGMPAGVLPQPAAPPPPVNAGGFGGPPAPGPRPFQDLPSMLPGGLPFQPWAAELR